MRSAVHAVFVLTLGVLPGVAFGWGADGHRAAGIIAERQLCAAAREETDKILKAESLAEAGLWADRIRGSDRWRHTGPWHYINVDDQVAITDAPRPEGGDILRAIEDSRAVLTDRRSSAGEQRDALRFYIHFIVDLHQPLHVGRAHDRGGNTVMVRLGNQRATLHKLWDTTLIKSWGLSPENLAAALPQPSADEQARWLVTGPWGWAAESKELRESVYSFRNNPGALIKPLDSEYIAQSEAIIKQRLTQAGFRLGGALNALWCDSGQIPAATP